MKYERLFTPLTIRGMTLKNRICMSGLGHRYTTDGYVTDQMLSFYAARARGGVGLVVVGVMRVDDHGLAHSSMNMSDDSCIESYRTLTDRIHAEGAKACAQLCHQGRYVRSYTIGDLPTKAPSAVYARYSKQTPEAFTVEEIHQLERDFAAAAARAVKAGFDMVEICGASGYLLSQFISGLTNQRTDEYGGSLENRTRFCREVYTLMRQAVGPDVPLSARISGNDMMPGGGGLPEAIAHAKALEEAGVDVINVTGGWHESSTPQITGELPRSGYAYLAGEIKKNVNCIVVSSNRMSYPEDAENVLALGMADMISTSRVLLADPEWPNKALQGREDEIRHCCACNQGCLANAFFYKPCGCIINPTVGKEYLYENAPAPEKRKRILVVGGGPGGCQVASMLADRGHSVTLWEKSARIGGLLPLVAKPPAKSEFAKLIEYFETILPKKGVEVVCRKEGTAEEIIAAGFDCVITATGCTPKMLRLPENPGVIPVYTAHDYLRGAAVAGRNVVIIGGGSIGCETAQVVAEGGSLSPELYHFLSLYKVEPQEFIDAMRDSTRRKVTIVDIAPKIGANFPAGTSWPLMQDLRRLGVAKYPSASVTEVGADSVTITRTEADGSKTSFTIPCDTIIQAVGSRPNDALFRELEGKVPELYNLGESRQSPGSILIAGQEALELAYSI